MRCLNTAAAVRAFSKVAREDPNYRPLVMMAFDYAKQGVTTVDEVLHLAEVVK